MNSQVDFFINLCQRYLGGQICTSDYIFAFEKLYITSEATLSEREFVVFNDIYSANDRFEASSKIRRGDTYLLSEADLQRLVQKGVNKALA